MSDLFRPHQYRYLLDKELCEVPAGSPTTGETLEAGALREFEEESGYRAHKIIRLSSFYPSVGLTNQICHIFLAFEFSKSKQKLEDSELIRAEWISIQEAVDMVKRGEIMNVGTAYGLLLTDIWLQTNSV